MSVWLAVGHPARADGVMEYRGRELLREGPKERGYCDPGGSGSPIECDRVLAKVLSGYGYARGHVAGGAVVERSGELQGAARARVSTASAALPGGDLGLGVVDGAIVGTHTARLRATLLDADTLFFCRDTQSDAIVAPLVGMFTRACATDAVVAADLGLFALQWDLARHGWIAEWARFGPAFELLGNGFGHAHLLRSVVLGVPFDVRSLHESGRPPGAETSLGAGLRIAALYRTPHWEARLTARHRTALAGGRGLRRSNGVEAELLALHNFFFSDALVMQVGFSLQASWQQQPEHAMALTAAANEQASFFAGAYLGWSHEAPDI